VSERREIRAERGGLEAGVLVGCWRGEVGAEMREILKPVAGLEEGWHWTYVERTLPEDEM
jgi:hypothetical protein